MCIKKKTTTQSTALILCSEGAILGKITQCSWVGASDFFSFFAYSPLYRGRKSSLSKAASVIQRFLTNHSTVILHLTFTSFPFPASSHVLPFLLSPSVGAQTVEISWCMNSPQLLIMAACLIKVKRLLCNYYSILSAHYPSAEEGKKARPRGQEFTGAPY